jgi:nucleotide-binding universal stress UspA family protein
MPAKKILFCTDFSRLSDAALPLATSLARDQKGALIVVHVQEPPAVYAAGELYYGPLEPDKEALQELLHRVTPADPAVVCTHQMVFGDPAMEIVRVAKDEGVGMIVMSSHGRTGLARVLMGSVAEKVVRRAHCPVVIFKELKEGQ